MQHPAAIYRRIRIVQFHLNGFQTGDPSVAPAVSDDAKAGMPDEVDVLIVGSGPAGLVLAAQLSQFAAVKTRIVERRAGALLMGQADGIACRTVEMLNAFGLSDRLLAEAYWVNETVFWRPCASDRTRIERTGRVQDVEDGLSEFPHVIVNQARIQDYLLDVMQRSARRLVPDYELEFVELKREDAHPYPVRVTLRGADLQLKTVRARYVVGCDGARSRVRAAIGQSLRGDVANHAWGVMDILAVTDFPDVRFKAAIQSASKGSLLIIPREGGYLVRFYVDLGEVTPDARESLKQFSAEQIISRAREILHPYVLDVKEVAWFSVYEVGQRLTERFDDAISPTGVPRAPRVFIAGDACHTHSAKAGQGMNVSMQDAFNLGWKLALVLAQHCDAQLLRSYSDERQPVAQELIDFDKKWSAMMAAAPIDPEHPEAGGVAPSELQAYFSRAGRYTAGVATHYGPGFAIGDETHQSLATGFSIGMRFHSWPVVRVADAKSVHLGHTTRADGRWRLYAFSDKGQAELNALCGYLATPKSFVRAITPPDDDLDSLIDVRAVLQAPQHQIVLEDLPALLLPRKGRYGLIDYEKTFTTDPRADIFGARGIDREHGALVVVRPDQFVAHVFPLSAYAEMNEFFGKIFRAQVK